MKKDFRQIRYFSQDSAENSPGVTLNTLVDGTAFSAYTPLSQLGVRALPGTKFYINGGSDPILIGFSGLFEIDLSNGGSISELYFDRDTIQRIESNDSAYLIVDMLGMKEE